MELILKGCLLALVCLVSALGAPSTVAPSSTSSWVTVPNIDAKETDTKKNVEMNNGPPKLPKIYSMKVGTNVTNRFATTLVTSKVKNLDEKAQEATFAVVLPETAYISGFLMEIDGKKYEAYVKEKEEAKKTYDNAVSVGTAAGLVEVNARDSNKFTVSVNIEPQSKATFYLTYEELLARQNGQYEIVINLHPGQLVKDLEVQVNVNETRPLKFVKAPSLRSGNEILKNDDKLDPKAEIEHIANNTAVVSFKPDIKRQMELAKNLGTKEGDGLAGQFVVQYDVERDPQGGEILVSDGYFVHFFAPKDLTPLAKHVIFVLDTSGSMFGTRIEQLKQAMKSILDQLHKEDTFNIIDFNSDINVWDIPGEKVQYQKVERYYWNDPSTPEQNETKPTLPGSFEANSDNIQKAKAVVEKLRATGGTNIFSALEVGLQLLKNNTSEDKRQPIIVFLTDGDPTVGETNPETIVSKVTEENAGKIPIFSLSFGDGADRSFLEKLSLRNQAFARHIYEGADAALQLESFYKYISSPLLNKIAFKYVAEKVSQVTKTNFPIFFDGSELVVAGRYSTPEAVSAPIDNTPIDPGFAPIAFCFAGPGPVELKPKFENPIGSLEKHWAYLTLKQILEDRDAADNKTELTKKALDIALKYSFVTPVSSLVVVKPNDTKTEANPEDASKSSSFGSHLPLSAIHTKLSASSAFGIAPALSFAGPSSSVYAGPLPSPINYQQPLIVGGNYDRLEADLDDDVMPIWSTAHPLLTTSSPPRSVAEQLKMDLPWLVNVFNATSETISLPQGEFKLDSPTLLLNAPECPRTPMNQTGTCALLKDCPQVYNLLTDLPTYSQFFCPLQEFAGVCCPNKITKS